MSLNKKIEVKNPERSYPRSRQLQMSVCTWLCVRLLELGAPFNATVPSLIATVHVTLTTHATSEGVTWAISRSARRAVERINEMGFTARTHENSRGFRKGEFFLSFNQFPSELLGPKLWFPWFSAGRLVGRIFSARLHLMTIWFSIYITTRKRFRLL